MAREGQPTPTQEENDRAKLGEHVLYKEYDGTGLDQGAKPIGAPDPEIPPPRPPIDPDNPPYIDNTLPEPEPPPVEPPEEPPVDPEEPEPEPEPDGPVFRLPRA